MKAKPAIVDIVVFDSYLEQHCVVTEDDDVIYEMEEMNMSRTRKEIKSMEELIKSKIEEIGEICWGTEQADIANMTGHAVYSRRVVIEFKAKMGECC